MSRFLKKICILFIILCGIIGLYYFYSSHVKIFLIGLDGASWDIINPLIQENKLPYLQYLIKNGTYGVLKSISPMFSPPLWTTIATGKAREKHGIMGFVVKDVDSGVLIPVTSNLRKVEAIWNILTNFNKRSIVLNYPVTYPPEKINGIMYGKLKYPPFLVNLKLNFSSYLNYPLVYPENISSILSELYDRASLKFDPNFEELNDLILGEEFSLYFLKQKWDFFTIYINSIDSAQHRYWKYMEPEKFKEAVWDIKPEDLIKFRYRIQDTYIQTNNFIGEILKKIDKKTIIFIVSDHGGEPMQEFDPKMPHISGKHNINGIIIIKGKNIKRNFVLKEASILDITPTILYLLGLPVGRDMDGRVLREIVTPFFRFLHPVKYISTYEKPGRTKYDKPIISPFDKKILEELRSLGYIQ